jgi:uncharacterized protein
MPSVTPADVLARRRELMLDGDADGFVDLFAPDAVMEFCFHGRPGIPVRLEGREAISEYSRRVMASPMRIEDFEVTELYQTQDPEVVIVEVRAKATLTTTGRSIAAMSIQVLRIQEGRIVLFRDFADPRIFEDLAGELRLDFRTEGRLRARGHLDGASLLVPGVKERGAGASEGRAHQGDRVRRAIVTLRVIQW